MKRHQIAVAAFVTLTAVVLGGCPLPLPTPTGADQFAVVQSALDAWLSDNPVGAMKAQDVFDVLNDGDETNDPYIISVRGPEDYAIGHVPGAVNIPWRTVAQVGALADVPTDRPIVVYCYTGHTGAVATAYLNAAGYDAVNMKYGIMSWTRDAAIRAQSGFDEATEAHDYPTEATDNPAEPTHDLPLLDVTTSTDPAEIIRAAADAYLSGGAPPVIKAADLFDLLNDGDETNDPVIVSVRAPADYAIGHIPGAINIPWKTIAKIENLKKLPTDRPIVVYCYTGHTGGLATMTLNMLGYEATNLKYGIMSWTRDAAVRVQTAFSEETEAHDYPTEP